VKDINQIVRSPTNIIGDILTGVGLFNGKDRKGLQDTNILKYTKDKLEKEITQYLETTRVLFKDREEQYTDIQKFYMYVESFAIYFYNKYYNPKKFLKRMIEKSNITLHPNSIKYMIHENIMSRHNTNKTLNVTYPDILIKNPPILLDKLDSSPKMLTAVFDILYTPVKTNSNESENNINKESLQYKLVNSIILNKSNELTDDDLNKFYKSFDIGGGEGNRANDGFIELQEFKNGVKNGVKNKRLSNVDDHSIEELYTHIYKNSSEKQLRGKKRKIPKDYFLSFFGDTAEKMGVKMDEKIPTAKAKSEKLIIEPIVTVINSIFEMYLTKNPNLHEFNYDDHYIETDPPTSNHLINTTTYTPKESRPITPLYSPREKSREGTQRGKSREGTTPREKTRKKHADKNTSSNTGTRVIYSKPIDPDKIIEHNSSTEGVTGKFKNV
jgi:hypothetical protein